MSSLREENAERVRQRIADAVAAHLAERGMTDLSLPAIARRAGISVATIYRYYRDRDALLDAYAAWVRRKLGVRSFETTLEQWPAQIEQAFTGFDGIKDDVRAQLRLTWAQGSFRHVRQQRLVATERMLEPLLAGLPEDQRRGVLGVLGVLTGAPAWQMMHDDWGLDGARAGAAAAWAVRVLLDELRGRQPAAPAPGPGAAERPGKPAARKRRGDRR